MPIILYFVNLLLQQNTDEFDDEKQSDTTYRIITEMTILTVQLIVEFAKRLPGFDKLVREDQITLLKVMKISCSFVFIINYIFVFL